MKILCERNKLKMTLAFENSVASYTNKTSNGNLKLDCVHPTKNNKLNLRNISKGSSNKTIWFRCDNCLHDFKLSPYNLISRNRWCSYCCVPSRKFCVDVNCDFCYKKSFASYTCKTANDNFKRDCWNIQKNKHCTIRNVTINSNKKYWFTCDICNHDFNSKISNVVSLNRWCPYCSNQKLCTAEDCKVCFNKSFASYTGKTPSGNLKLDYYNKQKNIKNGVSLLPRQVFKKCTKKLWFSCDNCNHEFNSELRSIVKIDTWCPYCCVPTQKLCGDINCKFCFDKSLLAYTCKTKKGKLKLACLLTSKNDKLNPIRVLKNSNKKLWFKCDECNHEFNTRVSHVTTGKWCPYCVGVQHCSDSNCTFCYKKSLQYILDTNPDIEQRMTIIFSKNITARSLPAHRKHKTKVICKICNNEKYMCVSDIAYGKGCGICKNKTEKKLLKWLNDQKNILNIKSIQTQYRPSWCGTTYTLLNSKNKIVQQVSKFPFDYLITFNNSKQVIIELDGRQHYTDIEYFQKRRSKRVNFRSLPSSLHQQIRDRYKELQAKKYGLHVIRVIQEDVWNNKNNWFVILTNQLKHKYL